MKKILFGSVLLAVLLTLDACQHEAEAGRLPVAATYCARSGVRA